jgi:hypothetical protein
MGYVDALSQICAGVAGAGVRLWIASGFGIARVCESAALLAG